MAQPSTHEAEFLALCRKQGRDGPLIRDLSKQLFRQLSGTVQSACHLHKAAGLDPADSGVIVGQAFVDFAGFAGGLICIPLKSEGRGEVLKVLAEEATDRLTGAEAKLEDFLEKHNG